jgi:hypothetical protein
MANLHRREKLIGLLRKVGRQAEKNPGAAYKALELVAYLENWLPAQAATNKTTPTVKDPETTIETMLDNPDILSLIDALQFTHPHPPANDTPP